ncbi:nuclear transport factor 2 family protein [Nocardia rhamnosiphila]|uniref:Nuclear transport factor 2 family protein n=1 Tax=Nocardia rhamnosiphila TaxID=426716 RepID=A0ABV2WRL0_9NOCA
MFARTPYRVLPISQSPNQKSEFNIRISGGGRRPTFHQEFAVPTVTEDRSEILNLLWRYANAIDLYANDDDDVDGWLDTLTDDAVVEYPGAIHDGRQELIQLAMKVKEIGGIRHIVVNPEVEVEGDSASIRAVLHVYRGLTLDAAKRYRMKIVRTAAGWRIAKVDILPSAGTP